MRGTVAVQTLVQQKLAALDRLQPEFEASFRFVQEVHGQWRFAAFPVAETVHYLHALWICECKDRLLSVTRSSARYEGRYCLDLMRYWQEGETAAVVAFLQRKLDGLPFADLTRQIQEATTLRLAHEGLVHGRFILLNRGMNLMQALDTIFSLQEDDLMREMQGACTRFGQHPSQIEQQLAAMEDPLSSYIPHQLLAQRNLQVMNKLGIQVLTLHTNLPGERSWTVVAPTNPLRPFAEHVIRGYLELVSP
jgi:hypothetical protein